MFLGQAKKVSASTNPTDRVSKRRPDTFFSTSRLILFGATPCVASCVVDRDLEREVDKLKSSKGKEILTVDSAAGV